MNKLMRKIEKLENDTGSKQRKLEEVSKALWLGIYLVKMREDLAGVNS